MSTLYRLEGISNTTVSRAIHSLARSFGESPKDFAARLHHGEKAALSALESLAGKMHARRGPGFTRRARMRGARAFQAATGVRVQAHVFDEMLTRFGPLRAAPTWTPARMQRVSTEPATDRQLGMLRYLGQDTTGPRGRALTKQDAMFLIGNAPPRREHYETLLGYGFDVIREHWCFDQVSRALKLAETEGLSVNAERLRFLRRQP